VKVLLQRLVALTPIRLFDIELIDHRLEKLTDYIYVRKHYVPTKRQKTTQVQVDSTERIST